MANFKEIIKAYTTKTDTEAEYYKYRREICDGCEHNTDNMEDGKSAFVRAQEVIAKVSRCNACGCPLSKKCGSKTATCGIAQNAQLMKTEKPKWTPVEIPLRKGKMKVYNLSTDMDMTLGRNNQINFNIQKYTGLITWRIQVTDLDGFEYLTHDSDYRTLAMTDKVTETKYDQSLEFKMQVSELVEGLNEINIGIKYKNQNNQTRRLELKSTLNYDK